LGALWELVYRARQSDDRARPNEPVRLQQLSATTPYARMHWRTAIRTLFIARDAVVPAVVACLVALDVAPLWYKSHRSFYFWSASGSLIITGTLFSKYGLDGEYRNEWIASLSFSLLLTFRRYASSWTRRQWVKLISSHVKSERQSKSFLSPPKSLMDLVEIVEDGGPLGPGVGKLWDACVGTLFFRLVSPHFRDFSESAV